MYIEEVLTEQGDTVSDAKIVVSWLLMISNILVIPSALISGIACDKFKVWKTMIVVSSLVLMFQTMMVQSGKSKTLLYIGYSGAITAQINIFLLVSLITLKSKFSYSFL